MWYRVLQLWRAMEADLGLWKLPKVDLGLNMAEHALFSAMSRTDQRHALAVWQHLKARGVEDPVLLKAALLHDVGKADMPVTLWHRGAAVLLKALAPSAAQKLATDQPDKSLLDKWSYPLYENARHPERSAHSLQKVGVDESVIALVRHHHDALEDMSDPALKSRLARLQQADNLY